MYQSSFSIPQSHPSLTGHFPGNPIVPGVVILDEVVESLRAWQVDIKITGFMVVKFLQPLLPEQKIIIHIEQAGETKFRFSCEKAGERLVQGEIKVESAL